MRIHKTTILLIGAGAALIGLGAWGVTSPARRARTTHPRTGRPLLVPGQDGAATLLFNGWRISPAGRSLPTGDMLLGGGISPDGKTFAIVNAGYNPNALHLVDINTEKEVANVALGRSWNGLAWMPDGQGLYIAGGVSNAPNDVYRIVRKPDGSWERVQGFRLTGNKANATCVAGLALSTDGRTLFALNNSDDSLYVLDTTDGTTKARLPVGDHPIVCKLSADGNRLYVANWGGAEVAVVDVSDPAHPKVTARLATGAHPNDLALSSDDRLFVSCGNADAVTVLDTRALRPVETIQTTLTAKSPSGSTPDALALTADNKTLYVANADNNDVCVVDVARRGHSRVLGFIPTGWYPTALTVSPDGRKVLTGSGKGIGSHPNPAHTPINANFPTGFQYIAKQLNGLLSFVDAPTPTQLAAYTRQVAANTPYHDAQLRRAAGSAGKTAIPARVGDPSPIKYVLYIIKENRTYDQVFGDIPKGNGDPNLCLFGQDVTPNHHALAHQFVLLDNLYCNGEVSADGHPWCDSAIADDFVQRAWVLSYSVKGSLRDTPSVQDPRAGYLWDACKRKGLSYRSYGENVRAVSGAEAPTQEVEGTTGLQGHGSAKYVGVGRQTKLPMRDTEKADVFIEEFQKFERTNTIPRFMVMSLGEDHTHGTLPGAFTPKAAVASNDQALGKIVEAISHSSVWKQFAIFIIEDDAQNGPDHVDSHRTMGLVVSPYVRHGATDSTMYSTASFVRTIELILGLPPLTQYDAAAAPLFASFTATPDLTPYTRLDPRISLNDKNEATAYGARASAQMDWSDYDRMDEDTLNRILWHSIKGRSVPMPAPVRRFRQ